MARGKKTASPKKSNGGGNIWMVPSTRRAVWSWLEDYQQRTTRRALCASVNQDMWEKLPEATTETGKDATSTSTTSSPLTIDGIDFPVIDDADPTAPYMALPSAMTSAQRKILHQLCQDVNLFHTTVDGVLYISVYADGFTWIPTRSSSSTTPQQPVLYQYRPWMCRRLDTKNDDTAGSCHQEQLTQEADTRILALIDQPGDCLREQMDTLVYGRLYRANLMTLQNNNNNNKMFLYVDTPDLLRKAATELSQSHAIAIDLEATGTTSVHTPVTCLIQLASDTGQEYVIDVLASQGSVWDAVHDCLQPLCANPAIVKIGHAMAGLDVPSLHRDFGLTIINAFDTHVAAQVLNLPQQGLAAVCAYYGLEETDSKDTNDSTYATLKAQYQTSAWHRRPLSDDQIAYARCDVRYLHRLRLLMLRDMVEGDVAWEYDATHAAAERQAAAEWRQSMLQWELQEDGMLNSEGANGGAGHDDAMALTNGAVTPQPTDALDVWRPDELEEDDEDDARTFQTSHEQEEDLLFLTPANSTDSFEDVAPHNNDITAAQLRLQPRVMRTLWLSQEACRDFWKPTLEPPEQNDLLVRLQTRSAHPDETYVHWTPLHSQCYDALVKWREALAQTLECRPAVLLPLDFLVLVAWKQPTTEWRLRRIRYDLPHVLETSRLYREQLLGIALRNAVDYGNGAAAPTTVVNDILLYEDTTFGKKRMKWRRWREMSWSDYESLAFSLAVGVVLCGAAAGMVMEGRRVRATARR